MYNTKVAKAVVLLLALCLMLAWTVDMVHAQGRGADKGVSGDKDLSSKKGLAVLDGVKKTDPTKVASKTQKAIGFASIFVMIAVVKWL